MQKAAAKIPTTKKPLSEPPRDAARRARYEMRILKRQQRHNNRIVKRREIQLEMYKLGIDPIPGWIEDMWKVTKYLSYFEDDDDAED
jgi:hypothetical protein